ncbi:MAG: DUF366 family protein [Vampirovibrionales bacterium]|nr:DUF366 family protein [Vampirovibrionales bacterium]
MPLQPCWLDVTTPYTGVELSPLWLMRKTGLQGSVLAAFTGPCNVPVEALVDEADVQANAPIASQQMLHFVAEVFHLDAFAGVLLQRLWMAVIAEQLRCPDLTRSGDDLFLATQGGLRKLSVSIATAGRFSVLIHVGLNLTQAGVPSDVQAAGLISEGLLADEAAVQPFAKQCLEAMIREFEQAGLAFCKVHAR